MTNTNVSQEKLTSTKCEEDELEVIENGGLSPHPSLRTEDDACSEIIRIEQGGSQDRDPEQHTTLERIVRTLQVRGTERGHRGMTYSSDTAGCCILVVPQDVIS